MDEQVISIIEDEPGIWTARICRRMNNIQQDFEGISYCGSCEKYANQRKRKRAEKFLQLPRLELMEPPHQLHRACAYIGISQLQGRLRKLEKKGRVVGMKRSGIPDKKQARGWDYATRWYITDSPEYLMQVFMEAFNDSIPGD